MNGSAEDVYVARKDGWPGYVAVAIVDVPPTKDDAKMFADWRKRGYIIERVADRDVAVAGLREYSAEKKRRAGSASAPEQRGLFA